MVVTDKNRKILVITKQKSGRRHNKRLADKNEIFEMLPKDIPVFVDTGFQGVQKTHKNIYMPKKEQKGDPLPTMRKK